MKRIFVLLLFFLFMIPFCPGMSVPAVYADTYLSPTPLKPYTPPTPYSVPANSDSYLSPKPVTPYTPPAAAPKPVVSTPAPVAPKPVVSTPAPAAPVVAKPVVPTAPTPTIPSIPKPTIPTPTVPTIPTPTIPSIPTIPTIPTIPSVPTPSIPSAPSVPSAPVSSPSYSPSYAPSTPVKTYSSPSSSYSPSIPSTSIPSGSIPKIPEMPSVVPAPVPATVPGGSAPAAVSTPAPATTGTYTPSGGSGPVNINVNVQQQKNSSVKEVSDLTRELLNRKTYRLGLRVGMMSPTDSITVTKDSAFNFGVDFDAKMNENLDMGPRFTYQSTKYNDGSTINATYGVLMFGFGARLYLTYWGDYGSTHGFFNAYISGDANYCAASKSSAVISASQASFAGFAANGGAGLELAFGPNATGFVDVRYQRSSIKDSTGVKFPLDGFVLSIGSRMAFF